MALKILSVVFCGVWVYALIYMHRSVARMPLLREADSSGSFNDSEWPSVSIIIPACNEADHIEVALTSLLTLDYPCFEVIVINDRSTDSTGEIIDRLAGSDQRVRAIHIESLPKGWLGKVHAMHFGVREASGDWYLFTDADVYFEPSILKRAISYSRQHEINHVTCLPEIIVSEAFWLDVTIRSFSLLFAVSTRLLSVNRKNSKWPVGIGAFNLVEASVFGQTPGFEWLRMEPADDLGLGAMLKNAGARTHLIHGDQLLRVTWYENIGQMIRGLEKNSFGPGANYSYLRQFAIVALLWLFALVPGLSVLAGFYWLDPILLGAGGLAVLTTIAVALLMPRRNRSEIVAYILLPVGILLMSVILLRAALLCLRNGGVDWRGTHYSIAELRAGQRVKL